MTAKDLHAMTAPLFAKHPSAKPPRFFFFFENPNTPHEECFCVVNMDTDWAALVIQGHLVEWLAERVNAHGSDLEIEVYKGRWFVKWEPNGYHSGDTLLESLIAACMKVEQ